MAASLPISIELGALPPSGKWTPQQFGDLLVSRMSLQTAQTFALFVTGSTAPTSDVGPWLKNGTEWYVWDVGTGAYVPITIPSESLGYWVGSDAPDHLIYSFWIQTSAIGSPLALKIYYSGAWIDVYATTLSGYVTTAALAAALALYATLASPALTGTPTAPTAAPGTNTTQLATTAFVATSFAPLASPALTGTPTAPTAAPGTNTTQAATTAFVLVAVAAIPSVAAGQDIFKAIPSAAQDIVHGAGGTSTTDVSFGTETFDPDGVFAASIFTAPANGYYEFASALQVSTSVVGGATKVAGVPYFLSSAGGNPDYFTSGPDTEEGTDQRFYSGSTKFYLTTGQTVKVTIDTTVDAACTVTIGVLSFFTGQRCR